MKPSEQIIAVLDALAEKLGVGVEYLIQVFTRRAVGVAIGELVVSAFLVVGLRLLWRWKTDDDDETWIKRIGTLVSAITLSLLVANAITILASPEAAAVSSILTRLKAD